MRAGIAGAEGRGTAMDGLARLILVTAMTAVMVLVVTLVATLINIGFAPGFFVQWAKSYIVSWPIAAATAYVVMPSARRLTTRVMALIGKPA